MNNILAELENLSTDDLIYLFEYLVDLINTRKQEEKCRKKYLKPKENLTKNIRAKYISAQTVNH